jgi:putative flippase GtrA
MTYLSGKRFVTFGLVGMSGMVIDFGVTWCCKELLGLNKYVSNSLGFCLAVSSNFFLHRQITFKATTQPIGDQFPKFLLVSVSGLLINNILLYFSQKYLKPNFYLQKLLVIGVVFFWNYGINLFFTFN